MTFQSLATNPSAAYPADWMRVERVISPPCWMRGAMALRTAIMIPIAVVIHDSPKRLTIVYSDHGL